jgi:hypothetical protein
MREEVSFGCLSDQSDGDRIRKSKINSTTEKNFCFCDVMEGRVGGRSGVFLELFITGSCDSIAWKPFSDLP